MTWTVYVVRHPETKTVRYVGLSYRFVSRAKNHLSRDWGHPIEVIAIAEYDNEKDGRLAENREIVANAGPQLKNATGQVLSQAECRAVAALLKSEGEWSTANRFGLSIQTLTRAGAGMALKRSTVLAVRLGLKEAS